MALINVWIRGLAGAEILFSVGFLVAFTSLENALPPALQLYLATKTGSSAIVVGIGFVILALHVLALFGLLFGSVRMQRGWARTLFLYSTLPLLLICLGLGPNVVHALAYTFDLLSVLVMGMLVMLLLKTES